MPKKKDFFDLDDLSTLKLIFSAKNQEQQNLLTAFENNDIILVKGSPGSGKTFLSVAFALRQLVNREANHIIITRPVVEAGEKLGYLPGNMYEKIDPYLMPIYESINQLTPPGVLQKLLFRDHHEAIIRIIPLAYMRGTTLDNSIIICDEMQNSTPEQVRMLLTRIGKQSKIIACGDTKQSDILVYNGLDDAFEILKGIEGIGFVELTELAIVRHPIIVEIEKRYEEKKLNGRREDKSTSKTKTIRAA